MKAINKKAQKVLETLIAGLDEDNRYKKIDNSNGTFMAVSVEDVGVLYGLSYGEMFSVAHYFSQNGDLMADPEMIFWKGSDGRYYPTYFKMDATAFVEESIFFEGGKPVKFSPRTQKDHAVFAGTWMMNIKQQQGL